jgi:hypothetical protein
MNSVKNLSRMKPLYKIFAILMLVAGYSCMSQRPVEAQRGYVSFQVFYDQLSPYGEWIDYPNYGYVWVPDAGPDFEPYSTDGYWVMTDYGWTWVSEYPWGWAPFHYGRWDFDRRIGWIWIPGNEWGPAWVTWRRSTGYYGWAPLRPGITLSMSFNLGYRDDDHWYFVRDRDFGRRDINRYYIDRREWDPIVRNSVVINNTYIDNRRNMTYISGPGRDEVQKYTGRRISNMSVRDDVRPGERLNNNQLRIYRPRVEGMGSTGTRPAPSRLSNINNIKPKEERNAAPQRNVNIPSNNNGRNEIQNRTQQPSESRTPVRQPQQAQPQQRMENQWQQPTYQQKTEPQRQQMEQQKQQQVDKQQQIQQQQPQPLGQQKREQRKTERTLKRMEKQQQKAVPNRSENNKAKPQPNEGRTFEPGRRQ